MRITFTSIFWLIDIFKFSSGLVADSIKTFYLEKFVVLHQVCLIDKYDKIM